MAQYTPDANSHACVSVKNGDGSSIIVYEQGAHLASWKNNKGEELLYLSPSAVFANRVALRGGVPLIFPQFGNRGPITPSHGYARLRPWRLLSVDNGTAVFSLRVSIQELSVESITMSESMNNAVLLEYSIHFSNTCLKLSMKIANLSEELPASFNFAFHTYFATNLETTLVNGLNMSPYIDNTRAEVGGGATLQNAQHVWTINQEFDHIYPNQTCAVLLHDTTKQHMLHISSPDLPDVVVWNPGEERCSKLKDLPTDGYKHFICVEHGQIMKKRTVQPSSNWVGTQVVHVHVGSPTEAKL